MEQNLATGRIGSPFGFKGYTKLFPFSDNFSHFFKLKRVVVEKNSEKIILEIDNIIARAGFLLVKFKEYSTLEQVRLLTGGIVWIKRSEADRLQDGEVYISDLIGMKLVFEGKEVGQVVYVAEGSQAPLLCVECSDGKKRFVPYLKNVFVKGADLDSGTIILLNRSLVE